MKKNIYYIYYRCDLNGSLMLYETDYCFKSYSKCLFKVRELNSKFKELVFYIKPFSVDDCFCDVLAND